MENQNNKSNFQNGIIFNLISGLINFCYIINIVEWFKSIVKFFTKNEDNKLRNIQVTIDLFIIVKFILVIFFWNKSLNSTWIEIIVWYLVISNVFTYFYYHIWIPPFRITNDSKSRRFINLGISLIFSNLCFAFLYSELYFDNFKLQDGYFKHLSSLLYSSFNSIFASYAPMSPNSDFGYFISFIQLSITFIFLSIILSVSIPQLDKNQDNLIK